MEQINEYFRMMLDKTRKLGRMRSLGIVTAGATALFVGITAYRNQDRLFSTFVLPVVHILPAETSHNLAVWACKHRLSPKSDFADDLNLHCKFFGRLLSNPIGIAAGFDKNAEAIVGLQEMGFGFVEVGTVTPDPQAGNPKPRVFRLPNDRAIINRYGFNSHGHEAVLERLRAVRERDDFNGVVGVNLGRNKDTKSPIYDYVQGVETFGPVADYLVINVSSPNTNGLRDLQSKDKLRRLLDAVNEARSGLGEYKNVPIFLKLSPDLDYDDMKDVVSVINNKKSRVDGLIVANTTVMRDNVSVDDLSLQGGGLSGKPLRARSTEMIAQMYYLTKGKIPIIGVGGVASGKDAFEKFEAGASYVQIYTALVYEGPEVLERIKDELATIVHKKNYKSIQSAVGTNYKAYLPDDD